MNITGIIAEYNPLHNGHRYHIEKSKSITGCDGIIAVISGNFVQRGIPSIIDKWAKTRLALLNGIDLVIELPVLYSLSSAEFFAFGAVSLLENLGIVKNLCFGSECDDIQLLKSIGKILSSEPEEFRYTLKKNLSSGISFPQARSNALIEFFHSRNNLESGKCSLEKILSSPNNILAIEYCKSLARLKSNITPVCIKRIGSSYNSLNIEDNFSSSSSIRNFIREKGNFDDLRNNLPCSVFSTLKRMNCSGYDFTFEDFMVPYLKYKYFFNGESLKKLPDVSEGIENRIFNAIKNNHSYKGIIESSKTKRYTYSRISRILCQFFLGFDHFDTDSLRKNTCPYIRVLGFNSSGKKILRAIKENSHLPIYTKMPQRAGQILKMDTLATNAYSLLNKNIPFNYDYIKSPIII
ncbi:MAG TPA: nucleotidyltransferase [Clostridium sp.]|jgi:predicted nucleotidyltransferase|uniref:tRNA(Met) cytidine acetate ligase n=1 Tax=Clostridium lapidicellarium TaxID=3240931 RepID=A0ABV4DUE4_9CLOT|nr:nucleotidyltransferase [uncultured Clostridium sp.]NLU07294.1 nucleotidyltransferase [Clostridiales bacterium]HBC97728.1 nucleotidyltransferase [Clostridium sp.]